VQFVVDALVVSIALALAYLMRFEGLPSRLYIKQFLMVLPYVVLLRLMIFAVSGVYRLMWRYISLQDIPRIVLAVGSGSAIILAVRYGLGALFNFMGFVINPAFVTVPYGVLAGELVLTTGGIIAVRAFWRIFKERERRLQRETSEGEQTSQGRLKALVIGAGSAGVMVAREVRSNPEVGFEVVGFLDDDRDKQGSTILGNRVVGATDQMGRYAAELGAELVVIAIADISAAAIRKMVEAAKAASLKIKIIPGLYEILSGRVNISKIRDVAIEDLLGRAVVKLEEGALEAFLKDKKVLVTGAGGSIGSEICRQVCGSQPRELLLLDQAENPLFHIHRELLRSHPDVPVAPVVGSVANRHRMTQVMEQHRPDVVFHAAAHKHVPLMERCPGEAIRNNVQGSRNMAELAHTYEASAFVMISTDKAVNPTSVMGATKRLAEMYIQALSTSSKTRFLTVRFGNVLGSEGSVVPIFKEQIARGGPVSVTHPEMMRYFMTIPEASQLVLEAATMGEGGEIFILEMGEPISIVSLARDLIKLSGFKPDEDIQIAFSGIRPGEKLYEEINLSEENATKTKHPRIWIGKSHTSDQKSLAKKIDALVAQTTSTGSGDLRAALAKQVPEYAANRAKKPE